MDADGDGGDKKRSLQVPATPLEKKKSKKGVAVHDEYDAGSKFIKTWRGSIPKLPPGFEFQPRGEDLIMFYLRPRLKNPNCELPFELFHDVNFADYHPQELVEKYRDYGQEYTESGSGGHRWFFFTRRVRKHPNGTRRSLKTKYGYWKTSGSEKPINTTEMVNGSVRRVKVGSTETLVFHLGEIGSDQIRTEWIMHEYANYDESTLRAVQAQEEELVICIIFQSKKGSRTKTRLTDAEGDSSALEPWTGRRWQWCAELDDGRV